MRFLAVLLVAGCSTHLRAGATASTTGAVGGELGTGIGIELSRSRERSSYIMIADSIGGTDQGLTTGASIGYASYHPARIDFDRACLEAGEQDCEHASPALRLNASFGFRHDPDGNWAALGSGITVLRITPRDGGSSDPCAPPGGQDTAICRGVELGVQLLLGSDGRTAVLGGLSFVIDSTGWFL